MLDTLEKLSGKTHKSYIESKTLTRDMKAMVNQMEGKISYTKSTQEKPVISFNNMLFIPPRNSMVFRAGDSPIWNRRETVLPMSWRLLQDTIKLPGKEFSLQTAPTLSSAMDFDVRKNQPDFFKMMEKRVKQAKAIDWATDTYKEVYGYTEADMIRLDPDVLSDDIMMGVNEDLFKTGVPKEADVWKQMGFSSREEYEEAMEMEMTEMVEITISKSTQNKELEETRHELERQQAESDIKAYADGRISKSDLVGSFDGQVNMSLQYEIGEAYRSTVSHFAQDPNYQVTPGTNELRGPNGLVFVEGMNQRDWDALEEHAKDEETRVYMENSGEEEFVAPVVVTEAFMKHLASMNNWKSIANGRFDKAVARFYDRRENMSYGEDDGGILI